MYTVIVSGEQTVTCSRKLERQIEKAFEHLQTITVVTMYYIKYKVASLPICKEL